MTAAEEIRQISGTNVRSHDEILLHDVKSDGWPQQNAQVWAE